MFGDILNWIGTQDPMRVFYAFGAALVLLTFPSSVTGK